MLLTVLGVYATILLGLVPHVFAVDCTIECNAWDTDTRLCNNIAHCICIRPNAMNDIQQCATCDPARFTTGVASHLLANFSAVCTCSEICSVGLRLCSDTDFACGCSQDFIDIAYSCYYCSIPILDASTIAALFDAVRSQENQCKDSGYVVHTDPAFVTSVFLPDGSLKTRLAPAILTRTGSSYSDFVTTASSTVTTASNTITTTSDSFVAATSNASGTGLPAVSTTSSATPPIYRVRLKATLGFGLLVTGLLNIYFEILC